MLNVAKKALMMARATAGSALVFTEGGTGWTFTNDGKTANRSATTGAGHARTGIARSTGPAAVSFDAINTSVTSNLIGVGLCSPTTNLNSVPTTGSVYWRRDGGIFINGSQYLASNVDRAWITGNVLKLRLNSDGTSLTLIRNDVEVLASVPITAASRVPMVYRATSGVGCSFGIEGAPAGETAWG